MQMWGVTRHPGRPPRVGTRPSTPRVTSLEMRAGLARMAAAETSRLTFETWRSKKWKGRVSGQEPITSIAPKPTTTSCLRRNAELQSVLLETPGTREWQATSRSRVDSGSTRTISMVTWSLSPGIRASSRSLLKQVTTTPLRHSPSRPTQCLVAGLVAA